MGHNRLGRLPQTRRWREVVELIATSADDAARVGVAVTEAADHRFRQLANDQTLGYTFWLLTRITWAARGTDFIGELNRLGISTSPSSSAFDIIASVSERVHQESSQLPWTGHFAEFAALALRSALTNTVAQQGPSFFDSGIQDVQRAFRTFSTEARFGELARRFLGNFMSRALQSFVDRELASSTSNRPGVSSTAAADEFLNALDTHTWEAARIVQNFAGDWYSKYNWDTRGDIDRDQAQRFVAQSLRKLRSELKRRDEPQ